MSEACLIAGSQKVNEEVQLGCSADGAARPLAAHGWTYPDAPPEGWWIMMLAWGRQCRLPSSPAYRDQPQRGCTEERVNYRLPGGGIPWNKPGQCSMYVYLTRRTGKANQNAARSGGQTTESIGANECFRPASGFVSISNSDRNKQLVVMRVRTVSYIAMPAVTLPPGEFMYR
jgi:hypothetical protein